MGSACAERVEQGEVGCDHPQGYLHIVADQSRVQQYLGFINIKTVLELWLIISDFNH